jgi:hypothetical protein
MVDYEHLSFAFNMFCYYLSLLPCGTNFWGSLILQIDCFFVCYTGCNFCDSEPRMGLGTRIYNSDMTCSTPSGENIFRRKKKEVNHRSLCQTISLFHPCLSGLPIC